MTGLTSLVAENPLATIFGCLGVGAVLACIIIGFMARDPA